MSQGREFDVIILGGGIAGMTAAIYGARASRRCAILETNITGGLVNSTYLVENMPSYINVHGMELMQKVREQVDALGIFIEEISSISSINMEGAIKSVVTEEATYTAKAVIVATGREPIPLPVEADCDNVHYCAICDGPGYKGKRVLVVGGGNSAFDESLYMLGIGIQHITLIEVMPRFFAAAATQDQLAAFGPQVDLHTGTEVVGLTVEKGKLVAATLRETSSGVTHTIACDGVFCFLGQRPNTEMFRDILELDDKGYILADDLRHTRVPGVFAAGDVTQKKYRQITTAMADGTIAMLEADAFVRAAG